MAIAVGIFVGGKSSRMGGNPKGLLPAPHTREPLVERLVRLVRTHIEGTTVVLVGSTPEYKLLGLQALSDSPENIGPLGGLGGLLRFAQSANHQALALACDLPFVTGAILTRLANESPEAAILAPRFDGYWQPLCARYDPRRVLPLLDHCLAERSHSFHALLERVGPAELPTNDLERQQLTDWDEPSDMAR